MCEPILDTERLLERCQRLNEGKHVKVYLDLLQDILDHGAGRDDRTGTGNPESFWSSDSDGLGGRVSTTYHQKSFFTRHYPRIIMVCAR